MKLERLARRDDARMVPRPLGGGLFEVDGTWGNVQPIVPADGVRTIGEPEPRLPDRRPVALTTGRPRRRGVFRVRG